MNSCFRDLCSSHVGVNKVCSKIYGNAALRKGGKNEPPARFWRKVWQVNLCAAHKRLKGVAKTAVESLLWCNGQHQVRQEAKGDSDAVCAWREGLVRNRLPLTQIVLYRLSTAKLRYLVASSIRYATKDGVTITLGI